jgi:PAS domain S-box-containing protein
MAVKPTPTPPHRSNDLSSLCRAVVEHAPLPMVIVEAPSHIVRYVNPAFCRLMDKSAEHLVGKQFCELVPESDECVELLDRVFRSGKSESYTGREHSRTRPVFWSYTMWPIVANKRPLGVMIQLAQTEQFHGQTVAMNQALMIGSVRQHELAEAAEKLNAQLQTEITERKRVEQALRQAQALLADRASQLELLVAERTAELTATNKQLEAFVHTMAHDLRAPLRSMQGFSAMLTEDPGTLLSEPGRDFANRINQSAQFMDALLQDLLAFSRIAQQRIELVSVNPETVVQAVLSRLEKEILEKNARVEIAGRWPDVLAHEPTLRQVLTNLVSNSLKFTRPDVPLLVRVRGEEISFGLQPSGYSGNDAQMREPRTVAPTNAPSTQSWVRVWVEDNGIGIAPEHQEQIFRLFTRLHGQKFPGTGVGLAIVQKGIERMGGRMGLDSIPGQGSRFWLELKKA